MESSLLNINYSFCPPHHKDLPRFKIDIPPNHQFSPKRLADYSSGRYCATKALEQLEIKDVSIPIGEDRAPVWPEGIVGSISHCDRLIGAIVAKSSDHISLGLDIEEIGRVSPDLWDLVFTENEKKYLSGLSSDEILVQSTAIFSIKEAFYKFQHPLTKTFLDFLDVEVCLEDFSRINVLSNLISEESIIRNNRVLYSIEKDCIVSIITQSEGLQNENIF
jgi:4'-phosphopantetheinyl transferase EntD